MYRVLIVDDEPIIRYGISALIDWEKENMTVEDQFENGAEALSAIEAAIESKPFDILITDIKMPIMDGIQLMKKALTLCPSLKVVFISSYNDFEYVHEGLKMGAVDYLLKAALEPEELLEVMHRCVVILDEERRKNSELDQYKQRAIYRERKLFELDIKKLIAQEQSSLSLNVWTPKWLNECYTCIYFVLDRAKELKENHGYLYIQLLLEEFQEKYYSRVKEGAALMASENSMFFLFPDHGGEMERQFFELKQKFETDLGVSATAGIATGCRKKGILKGFSASSMVYQRRFFDGIGKRYKMNEPEYDKGSQVKEKETAVQDWGLFFELIRNGEPVAFALKIAIERWKSGSLSAEQVKEEACSLLLQADTEYVLHEQLEVIRGAETLEQVVSLLIEHLEEIKNPYFPKLVDKGLGGQTITKVLEYMAAHYTENLTLQRVADYIHLSKNYLSCLFKKQTGLSFIDYLIELRIREAKRLLIQNEKRIYEVAALAGFKDVKYFGKMFKKVTELTPLEYRKKHLTKGFDQERTV
ncbi:response regulator [Bacillus gobiensis]|uniref:response regulator transcription factor n=1 Tax=Bacillus gobiensis TaxID=1441095 RepID=UPI003D24E54E